MQFCAGEDATAADITVRRILALREAVRRDIFDKISKWGQVNYVWCAPLCAGLSFQAAESLQ
jgi:hypothetical protein